MKLMATSRGSLELSAAMALSGFIGYFAVVSGQSAWNLVFFRCLLGVVVLGLYAAWRGWPRGVLSARNLIYLLLGGLALVSNWALLFLAFDALPFSVATMVYHVQPLLLVLGGTWLVGERVGGWVYLWLGVAFAGLVFVVDVGREEIELLLGSSALSRPLLGMMLALGAAALYALSTLLSKKTPDVPPHWVALAQVSIGVPFALPFVDFAQGPVTAIAWGSLLFLGLINTGLQYILMYAAFQRLSTGLIAALSFIYPVVALLVDHLAFDTRLDIGQFVGVGLILLAAAAVRFGWAPTRADLAGVLHRIGWHRAALAISSNGKSP